jgi:hypothetical protein
LFLTTTITVKTLAIRNSAEELMISRRAQLKSQDQKASSLTDDFTMRNFISVGPSFRHVSFQSLILLLYENPKFMQENAYEPLVLNIPLLGGSTEGTLHNPEPALDTIVAVEDEQPLLEPQGTITEESSPFKKKRSIRFAE